MDTCAGKYAVFAVLNRCIVWFYNSLVYVSVNRGEYERESAGFVAEEEHPGTIG